MKDYKAFNYAVNSICDEIIYVSTIEGFGLSHTKKYLENIVENKYPHLVAIDNDKLTGWCGVVPESRAGFRHVGILGLGVIKQYRGKGIGKELLTSCLKLTKSTEIEKIELEVFSDNDIALKLYASIGFKQEGLKVRARKLNHRYQDIITMAMFVNDINV